jgi:dihydroorotate dehydrogenase
VSQDPLAERLRGLIISAPFGNYIQPEGATPTIGTYTAQRRGGRSAAFGRALLTVRYYRRLGAWVNRIGLRNPGIDSLATTPKYGRPTSECLLSVHGFDPADWETLLARTARLGPLAVELNVSCPNVGEVSWPAHMFEDAVASGVPVIVKIPPIRYEQMVEDALSAGITWVHATNTLPVPRGGMSGAPLKPLALTVVERLRARYATDVRIIGGGGIRAAADIADYARAGADRFAVGTHAMRPSALRSDAWAADLIAAADAHIGAGL